MGPNDGPLAWLDGALAELDRHDLLRTLRHHRSGAEPWLELAGGRPRLVLHRGLEQELAAFGTARELAA